MGMLHTIDLLYLGEMFLQMSKIFLQKRGKNTMSEYNEISPIVSFSCFHSFDLEWPRPVL